MNDIAVFGRVRGVDRGIREIAAVTGGLIVVTGNRLAAVIKDGPAVVIRDELAAAVKDGLTVAIRDGLTAAVKDGLTVAVKDGLTVAIRDGLTVAIGDGLAVAIRDGLESAWGSGGVFIMELMLARGEAVFVEWEYVARGRCFVLKCELDCDSSSEAVIVRVRDVVVMLVPMSQLDAQEAAVRGHW